MEKLNGRTPTVSAMMPAYNVENYIGDAIESILNQTCDDWELIIVDDGSTDDTGRILEDYKKIDPRIHVVFMEHKGRGAARNKCLEHSSGKFIAVCDSDDISLPDRFSKEVNFLENHPEIGVVGSQVVNFHYDLPPIRLQGYPEDSELIKRTFDRGRMGVMHPSSMYRRELIEQVGPYCDECLRAQDLELFLRFNEVTKFQNLQDNLVLYRNNPRHASYKLWIRLSKYGRYAIYRRDQFRKNTPSESFSTWEKTFNCRWRVYTLDTLKYVRHSLRYGNL